MRPLLALAFVAVCSVPPHLLAAESARMPWAGFKKTAAETGGELLRVLFKEGATEEELGRLASAISTLEAQLDLHRSGSKRPGDFATVDRAVSGMGAVLSTTCTALPTLEERVAALETRGDLLENDLPAIIDALTRKEKKSLERERLIVDSIRAPKRLWLKLPGATRWNNSKIFVTKDMVIDIRASGLVFTMSGPNATGSGPDGQQYPCDGSCTLPTGSFGQLVAKIGEDGLVFSLGSRVTFQPRLNGFLYLGVNDCCSWSDNSGRYEVEVARSSALDRPASPAG